MNLKQRLSILKNKNNDNVVVHPTDAKIYVGDSEIEMSINGTPSIIEIKYKGICALENKLPLLFKVNFTKHSIIIINLLKKELPKLLFNYTGKIEIFDCEILAYDLNRFKAQLYNNQLQEIVEGQKTKFEDDTMVIYDEQEDTIQTPFKRGFSSYNFIDLVQNARQKLDGVPKEERTKIIEKAVKIARPKLAPKIKTAIKKTPTPKGGKY